MSSEIIMNWKRIQQRIGLGLLSMIVAIALLSLGALPSVAAESPNPQSDTARTLLKTAYDNRYTWDKDFPGYQAEVAVRYQDTSVQGSVLLDANLQVATQNVIDPEIRQAIMAQVQMAATQLHATTFDEMHGQYQFALISNEGNTAEIEETNLESSDRYLVKDQEMVQVKRNIGELIIEIKTLDSVKVTGGYLQTHFQAIFRDAKTAELIEQDDIRDSYEQVGNYYLLAKREIRRGNAESWLSRLYPDTTLRFSNFQLLPKRIF
jgi:Protein of unknown function (DUF3386)